MSAEDAIVLFRMFAIALGGVVLVLAVGRHVRREREERRRERAREWRAAQSQPLKTQHPLDAAFLAARAERKAMNGEPPEAA